MALNALEAWPLDSLSVHLNCIEACAKSEPWEEVQQKLQGLQDPLRLNGSPTGKARFLRAFI
ncbi:hypothetical protein [Pantoea sp. Nvir]|uniref:hypothetical protein n=1 Tax=Pantoea sp. Nvir TaxID=2576760 RepID=UPI0030CCE23F